MLACRLFLQAAQTSTCTQLINKVTWCNTEGFLRFFSSPLLLSFASYHSQVENTITLHLRSDEEPKEHTNEQEKKGDRKETKTKTRTKYPPFVHFPHILLVLREIADRSFITVPAVGLRKLQIRRGLLCFWRWKCFVFSSTPEKSYFRNERGICDSYHGANSLSIT